MRKVLVTLVAGITLCAGVVFAGTGGKVKGKYEKPYTEERAVREIPSRPMPSVDQGMLNPNSAVPTTLNGWYDYQSNGGSIQEIRVNPANGNIHVTWMTSFDSTEANNNASRRVVYAFSTNGGASWNNFSSIYVPDRRGGFPTIDLGQGPIAGSPIISDHSVITGGNVQATIFIDSPEGGGAFAEIAPPTGFGTDEAIWPYVAGASDGSVIMAASRNTAATAHYSRTADYISWSPMTQVTEVTQSGGRNPVQANGNGRVGMLYNNSNGTAALGNWWLESTNFGVTWSTPVNIFGQRIEGGDTLDSYVHCDFVYNGDNPLFVFTEFSNLATSNREDIVFYSQATGFKVAVPYDSLNHLWGPYNNPANPQRFHNLMTNFPTIGLSGSTIIVAFQAFEPDTDRLGWNYSDLWYVSSGNGGNTWSAPQRITNTPFVDERYPSVSKWNAPGEFNIVWTQKTGASGLYAFPGSGQPPGADTVRAFQMYEKISLQFALSVPLINGWNMISNPVINPSPDDSAKHIFPTIGSRVFRFNNGYIAGDTMGNGIGYWGKFPGATTQPITGTPLTRDSISVASGWNMVGSISNPVDTSTIVSVPPGLRSSNWFGYSGGYSVTNQINPGKAYWVKSNAAGKFVFASPAGTPKAQSSGAGRLDGLNLITITDSKGMSQTLYFGADAKNEIQLPLYEMPPLPPVGAFDARFETVTGGSMVQTHGVKASDGLEFPISIQSDAYPLTISWNVKKLTASYQLTDGVGGRVFAPKEMRGEGSIRITNSGLSRVSVRVTGEGELLPKQFALSQNYPNPFNPSTTIKYDLPVDTHVSLKIFNIVGQEVVTLVNEDQTAGYQSVRFNAGNLASGMYFYRIQAGTFSSSKKLLLLK